MEPKNGTRTSVHSFDVYGVIVNEEKAGRQIVDLFRETSQGDLPEEIIEERVKDYQALLRKGQGALTRKAEILNQVYSYALERGAKVDLAKSLYPDALETFAGILEGGQQITILGSKKFDTEALPKDIKERMTMNVYGGPKNNQGTFVHVANEIENLGGRLVSHSEDTLLELKTAESTGIIKPENLVQVVRNGAGSPLVSNDGYSRVKELRTEDYLGRVI